MKMLFLLSLFLLIKVISPAEEIVFTAIEISENKKCDLEERKYHFDIEGSVKDKCEESDKFLIDLSEEKEATCRLLCEEESLAELSCDIDIQDYPLENSYVTISKKGTPKVSGVVFENWEDFVSEGNATIGKDITCKIETTKELSFIATKMKFNGGCIWKNVSFSVAVNLTEGTLGQDLYFNLPLSLPKDKCAYCRITEENKSYYMFCNSDVSSKNVYLNSVNFYDETENYYIYFLGNNINDVAPNCENSFMMIVNKVLLLLFVALLL